MSSYRLRPALASDAVRIRLIIHQVHINPLGLDWRRFILAVDEHDRAIGTGQVKPHQDGSRELASIAVVPEWRGQEIARAIIEHLLAANPGTLYLTCGSVLGGFYKKFGFRPVGSDEMPPYFRRLSRLAELIVRMKLDNDSMLVMKRD